LVLAAPLGAGAADAWDQARATGLAKQLAGACAELYDAFYREPRPAATPGQSKAYYRLKQLVRRIRSDARVLAKALERGEGRDETQDNYDFLMQVVRRAEDEARSVFSTQDVREKADAARSLLGELSRFYEDGAANGG
jgi:hypothetical protein